MDRFRKLLDRAKTYLAEMTPATRFMVGNAVLVVGATWLGCIASHNPGVAACTMAAGNWWLRVTFPDIR